jgi:hypothetical protein
LGRVAQQGALAKILLFALPHLMATQTTSGLKAGILQHFLGGLLVVWEP